MFSEPKSGLTHGKSALVLMSKCFKNGSKSATSILFALLLGAVIGGLFGLLDTAVKYVLISGDQENVGQQMSRSALEGSFVGAVFGSLFAGLKLMMGRANEGLFTCVMSSHTFDEGRLITRDLYYEICGETSFFRFPHVLNRHLETQTFKRSLNLPPK